jgi:hypothetical protein
MTNAETSSEFIEISRRAIAKVQAHLLLDIAQSPERNF